MYLAGPPLKGRMARVSALRPILPLTPAQPLRRSTLSKSSQRREFFEDLLQFAGSL